VERSTPAIDMWSQKQGEPLVANSDHYGRGGMPVASRLSGESARHFTETLYAETETVPEGEGRAGIPILYIV
jgi:hypothetical protein